MRGAAAYEAIAQATTPPNRVVPRVVERAMSFVAGAERAIAQGDAAAAHDQLVRAQVAVTTLRVAFQPEVHPELAKTLLPLYDYLRDRLAWANVHKDPRELPELRKILATLLEAWDEAARSGAAAAGGPP